MSILVHPYRAHKNTEELAFHADLIEIWNSHSRPLDNIRAIELAKDWANQRSWGVMRIFIPS